MMRTKSRAVAPFVVLVVSVVVIAVSGCGSLLNIERTQQTQIPLEPARPAELAEALSRQAAYAGDVLRVAWALGVEAHNEAVRQAVDAAAYVESVVGGPAERLRVILQPDGDTYPPGPPALQPNETYVRELADAQAALAEYRELLAAYAQALDDARAEAAGVKPGIEVSSGWLGWIAGIGWLAVPLVLAALIFLVPNQVLVMLVKAGVGALRSILGEVFLRVTHSLEQVVEGVQRGKERLPPDAQQALGKELLSTTTPATRKVVARIKEAVKDRIRQEAPT